MSDLHVPGGVVAALKAEGWHLIKIEHEACQVGDGAPYFGGHLETIRVMSPSISEILSASFIQSELEQRMARHPEMNRETCRRKAWAEICAQLGSELGVFS